jgi:hypothetical protein
MMFMGMISISKGRKNIAPPLSPLLIKEEDLPCVPSFLRRGLRGG